MGSQGEVSLGPRGRPWRSGQLKALFWPCSWEAASKFFPKEGSGAAYSIYHNPHVYPHLSGIVVLEDRHHFHFIDEETEARAFSVAISLLKYITSMSQWDWSLPLKQQSLSIPLCSTILIHSLVYYSVLSFKWGGAVSHVVQSLSHLYCFYMKGEAKYVD